VEFVKEVLKTLESTPQDEKFKYMMLSKLPEEDSANLMMQHSTHEGPINDYLLDYGLRNHFWDPQNTIDLEKIETTNFLPLSIFMETLTMSCSSESDIKRCLNWDNFMFPHMNRGN